MSFEETRIAVLIILGLLIFASFSVMVFIGYQCKKHANPWDEDE